MLPKITELNLNVEETTEDIPPIGMSFLYDFDKGDFVYRDGKLVELYGVDSLRMWIMKVMKTERFRFRIYDDISYGISLEELIGSNFPRAFVEAEIKREVTETLISHAHIDEIRDWQFERDGKWMRVKFTVISPTYNTFEQEVPLSV